MESLVKYVQDEFLKEDLDLTERVDIFIKFIINFF